MESRWRIKEFAARTGVPEVTLRAWERRYGLLVPERSSGGYRLYGPADERRVIAMQAHAERGVSAAEAARLALAEQDLPADIPSDPGALRERLLDAIGRFDAHEVDAMLAGAWALGTTEAVTTVILPVMAAVGAEWERGTLTVGHEHFASHIVERHLQRHAERWGEGAGDPVLLACPPGERHTIGLMCFGVLLAERGRRVAYLGADTPIASVRQTAAALGADLVVLSAVDRELFTRAAHELRALALERRLMIAGAGATAVVAKRLKAERAPANPLDAVAAVAV